MSGDWSDEPSAAEWCVSPNFMRRVVDIPPHCALAYAAGEWRDTIGVVESGTLEVDDIHGGRWRFGPGSTLALDGVAVRCLGNPGAGVTTLVLVSRVGRQTAGPDDEEGPR